MIEKISPFQSKPRQCLNWWQFYHARAKCKYDTICKKCSGSHVTTLFSNESVNCVSSKSPHLADNRECSIRKKELDFLKFKAEQHLPFTEACRRFSVISRTKNSMGSRSVSYYFHSKYITRVDIEQTLNQFVSNTQKIINQVVQQIIAIFMQALDILFSTIIVPLRILLEIPLLRLLRWESSERHLSTD